MAQKKYDQIHETVLKDVCDIFEMINGLADDDFAGFVKRHKNGRSIRSIARASNDLICVFPVLSSRNIAIDTQAMTAKAIEKNCVSMLQILFSALQLSNADNAIDFMQQFHTNINKSAKAMDLDDLIDIADAIAESAVQAGAKVDWDVVNAVKEDMKNLNFVLPADISPRSISETFECNLTPNGQYKIEVMTEKSASQRRRDRQKKERQAEYDSNINNFIDTVDSADPADSVTVTAPVASAPSSSKEFDTSDIVRFAAKNKGTDDDVFFYKNQRHGTVSVRNSDQDYIHNLTAERDRYASEIDGMKLQIKELRRDNTLTMKEKNDQIKQLQAGVDQREKELTSLRKDIERYESNKSNRQAAKDYADIAKNQAEFLNKQVLNTEYKKANELQPTLMVVNFKSRVGDGYEVVESVVIGVKAKLYPIDSQDIITHVVSKAKDANLFQKWIKASTREISFFKDFLFSIDKAKVDALSYSKRGSSSKMWKVLERRAFKSKWNRFMARSNDATAITTLMLSQNEVDFMEKEYNVNIADVSIARSLLEMYNFLGIVIVDEALEVAKFMWDTGEDMWETVAFSHLERESNDNTYKKVVNLMTRVM